MKFKHLRTGQEFDFINDFNPMMSSFYHRCVKTGVNTYDAVDKEAYPHSMEVGSTDCTVHHVGFGLPDVFNIDSDYPRIYCDREDLTYNPPDWMRRGLQQTRSGYGNKLNTGLSINFNGKLYRLYSTCYSNAGSVWFTVKGKRIYVS